MQIDNRYKRCVSTLLFAIVGYFITSCIVIAETEKHWLDEYRNVNPELFNDEGYRKRQYRAPTPTSSDAATLIDTVQLQAMLASAKPPKMINVLPLKTFENGYVIENNYTHIASSIWLPNVGRGTITQEVNDWFFAHLKRLSEGDYGTHFVFYCRADCWMSWNTIKRVSRAGYTGLYWYRDGLDGWRENGLPEVAANPESYFSQN